MKKKVIHVVNDKDIFETRLNEIEGKFTQTSLSIAPNGDVHYLAVLFYED